MVSEPQEPFFDLRFSKLDFKIFEHGFRMQLVAQIRFGFVPDL